MNSLQATCTSMAVSIGIVMYNAGTNQHDGQNIANASLSVCCKAILLAAVPKKKMNRCPTLAVAGRCDL